MQEWLEFHAGSYLFPNWKCGYVLLSPRRARIPVGICHTHGKSRRPALHPNTQTEELPGPPTQGKPSTGDEQLLLTHRTNEWSHFICVEWARRQSIKHISRANFPFLFVPCKTSFDSWSTAAWKKTSTHVYSPEWKWLPRSWHFLLPPGHPSERIPALLYPQMSPALSSAPVMPWGPSISSKEKRHKKKKSCKQSLPKPRLLSGLLRAGPSCSGFLSEGICSKAHMWSCHSANAPEFRAKKDTKSKGNYSASHLTARKSARK